MPKVSVIVPNYNHAPYLKQRIDSILAQSYQDFELILLDDCSTDNSTEILNAYAHHPKVSHIILNEKNSGTTFKQWDKGIQLAVGEYIWIAESDDWADSLFLDLVISACDANSKVGLAFVASKYVDYNNKVYNENSDQNTGDIFVYEGKKYISERFLFGNAIGNASSAVFKKEYYYQLKDSAYKQMTFCGDWFFYIQLCELGDVIYIQSTLNYYRTHNGNVSTDANRNGKYFTEGFEVFKYISKIQGVIIPNETKGKWSKIFVKLSKEYNFSKDLKNKITKLFYSYSPLIRLYIYYWKLRFFFRISK